MSETQDRYWIRPTDLASDWVRLGEDIEKRVRGHTSCQVKVGVIVSGGAVSDLIEIECFTIENRKGNTPNGGSWWSVIRRIRSVSPERGRSLVTIYVTLDSLGNPTTWTKPQVLQVLGRK